MLLDPRFGTGCGAGLGRGAAIACRDPMTAAPWSNAMSSGQLGLPLCALSWVSLAGGWAQEPLSWGSQH